MTKFKTKKWIKLNHLSVDQYSANKKIRLKTPVLRSDLSDYSDGYFVIKGIIDHLAAATNENDKAEKLLRLKMLHLDYEVQKLTVY